MKKLISILVIVLLVSSCDTRYSGSVDIEGYLMHKCGSNDPIGGQELSFTMVGKELITTTTQSNGYFHLKGDYSFKSRKFPIADVSIVGNGQNGGFGSVDILESVPDKVKKDTIYLTNRTFSVLTIQISNSLTTSSLDTIYFVYSYPFDQQYTPPMGVLKGFTYDAKFAGPFVNGQILDTVTTVASPHVGYGTFSSACTYFLTDRYEWNAANKPNTGYYHFVRGQRNIACGQYTNVYIKLD